MDYTRFKLEILKLIGIDLNAYKENQMKRRIDAMIKNNQCTSYEMYLQLLKDNREKYTEFENYLTINVSEFFRNPTQWSILEKDIFPLFLNRRKKVKIWSAACSTGDEPYSLAMLLSRFIPLSQIEILATDIDKAILKKAKEGIYSDKHIQNVPDDLKGKYFEEQDNMYVIHEGIKKCITFKQHDLLKDPYPEDVDLIVCRNVLIYFTEEAKNEIYTKFSKSLSKEGILFVGSTEQIMGAKKFDLMPYRVFFYQKQPMG